MTEAEAQDLACQVKKMGLTNKNTTVNSLRAIAVQKEMRFQA